MKILLTGAEIIKIKNRYQVVYKRTIVLVSASREEALMLALNSERLNKIQKECTVFMLKCN